MLKTILCLGECMVEEAESSVCYAKHALEYQYSRPMLGELMRKMAQTELQHAKALHEQMSNIRTEYENQKSNLPESITEKFNCYKCEYLEKIQDAQILINLY